MIILSLLQSLIRIFVAFVNSCEEKNVRCKTVFTEKWICWPLAKDQKGTKLRVIWAISLSFFATELNEFQSQSHSVSLHRSENRSICLSRTLNDMHTYCAIMENPKW